MQPEGHAVRLARRPYVRRHPRTLLSVPVTLQRLMAGGIRTSHGISLDISESGVGILVEGGVRVGDMVEIKLKLPERELSTIAIVRHSSSFRSGCEFVGLRAEERAYLARVAGRA